MSLMKISKSLLFFTIFLILIISDNVLSQSFNLTWPLSNSSTPDVMTSTFGMRHDGTVNVNYDFHNGVDLSAVENTPVHAPYNGKVLYALFSTTGGYMIGTSSESNQPYLNMRFLHLNSYSVALGDNITQGQNIGVSGNTGSASQDPHLHIETYISNSAEFPNSAVRSNPVQFFPGINKTTAPSIVLGQVFWYDPEQTELDQFYVHIEVNSTEMDLKEFHIREWNPINSNTYSQLTFSLEDNKVYDFNNSTTPTNEFSIESTNASDYWYDVWCESNNYCCAELYIIPQDYIGGTKFIIDILINPWIPENSSFNYWGLQAFDVFGNTAEWGNFGGSPKLYVKDFNVSFNNDLINIFGQVDNCQSLKRISIERADKLSNDTFIIKEYDLNDQENEYVFSFNDTSAHINESYTYSISLFDKGGNEIIGPSVLYEGLPSDFYLSQNYPNPFNPRTNIEFIVNGEKSLEVNLSVFNLMGQRVRTIHSGITVPGRYIKQWDSTNENGSKVSSGVYLYKLEVEDKTEVKKMLLLK